MDVLRKFIRSLTEAALGAGDLPSDAYVLVKRLDSQFITIQLVDPNQEKIVGEVGLHAPDDESGPCAGAWIISSTHAQRGWGPLLYDVAIEWATMNGPGLAPDRESVSRDAYKVWDYYFKNRSDVKHTQFSSEECSHLAAAGFESLRDPTLKDPDERKRFMSSPLTKYYSKAPTTINQLKKMGKIRIET